MLEPGDLIVAADGGARHAWAAGVTPHVIIGDLDSLSPEEEAQAEASGARFVRFSPRKDETDLELALRYAAAQGAAEIVILGALGGRLDQTIANLLLLALPELRGVDVRVFAGRETISVAWSGAVTVITGQPGNTVSLIPLGGDAVGVTTDGLEWELQDDTLRFGPARGVSNVLTGTRAQVRLREGMLWCVVIHAEKWEV
jgi:thiamine pyrophosphokinase